MTEPRTPALAGSESPGLRGSRVEPAAAADPFGQAILPESSPASRLQRVASPAADGRGAPGAAAAPSRAWPCPSPRPGGASTGRAAPTRARPGPGPAALSSAVRLRLPAARSPRCAGRAWRGRGARYRRRGGWGGAAEIRGGDTGGPAPPERYDRLSPDTAPAYSCQNVINLSVPVPLVLPDSPRRAPIQPSLSSQTLGTLPQGLQDWVLGMGSEARQEEDEVTLETEDCSCAPT